MVIISIIVLIIIGTVIITTIMISIPDSFHPLVATPYSVISTSHIAIQ